MKALLTRVGKLSRVAVGKDGLAPVWTGEQGKARGPVTGFRPRSEDYNSEPGLPYSGNP